MLKNSENNGTDKIVLVTLSCGDTCQTWMWFKESNRYFRKINNFAYRKINEWSFSNPHPCLAPSWYDLMAYEGSILPYCQDLATPINLPY